MPEIYDDSGAENNVRCVKIAHCTLTLTSYLHLGGRVNWPLSHHKRIPVKITRVGITHSGQIVEKKKAMCVRSARVTLALYFPALFFTG